MKRVPSWKRNYTVDLTDGLRVKHGSKARFTVKTGNSHLQDSLVPIEDLSAAIAVSSIVFNRSSMSGGLDWWDPETGKSIKRPHVLIKVRPEDVLTGDQECDCERCSS